jgi:hypothetical protein
MAVRSARLQGPASIAAGGAPLTFTCPVDKTVIVKRMTVRAGGGAGASVSYGVFIGAPATGTIIEQGVVAVNTSLDKKTWWVLEPGDTLYVTNDGPGTATVSLHGALLAGVA